VASWLQASWLQVVPHPGAWHLHRLFSGGAPFQPRASWMILELKGLLRRKRSAQILETTENAGVNVCPLKGLCIIHAIGDLQRQSNGRSSVLAQHCRLLPSCGLKEDGDDGQRQRPGIRSIWKYSIHQCVRCLANFLVLFCSSSAKVLPSLKRHL